MGKVGTGLSAHRRWRTALGAPWTGAQQGQASTPPATTGSLSRSSHCGLGAVLLVWLMASRQITVALPPALEGSPAPRSTTLTGGQTGASGQGLGYPLSVDGLDLVRRSGAPSAERPPSSSQASAAPHPRSDLQKTFALTSSPRASDPMPPVSRLGRRTRAPCRLLCCLVGADPIGHRWENSALRREGGGMIGGWSDSGDAASGASGS